MATRTAQNNAVATNDKWTITCALTFAAGDTVTVTINGKNLVVTIGSLVTTAQVATTIKEAFNGTAFTDTTASCLPTGGGPTIPEMNEYTATVSGSTVILTADTAGIPGTISSSESTAGDGTASIAHTVTATGPYCADNTANWAEGVLPADTDTVVIDGPIVFKYGLDMNTIQPTLIKFGTRCTAVTQIGLPLRNAAGYEEYRTTEWLIGPTTLNVYGAIGLLKLSAGTDQLTANIYTTGTTLETGLPTVQLRGTHASNAVNVYGGTVGFATRGQTATLANGKQYGGTLSIGSGTTYTTLLGSVTILG